MQTSDRLCRQRGAVIAYSDLGRLSVQFNADQAAGRGGIFDGVFKQVTQNDAYGIHIALNDHRDRRKLKLKMIGGAPLVVLRYQCDQLIEINISTFPCDTRFGTCQLEELFTETLQAIQQRSDGL